MKVPELTVYAAMALHKSPEDYKKAYAMMLPEEIRRFLSHELCDNICDYNPDRDHRACLLAYILVVQRIDKTGKVPWDEETSLKNMEELCATRPDIVITKNPELREYAEHLERIGYPLGDVDVDEYVRREDIDLIKFFNRRGEYCSDRAPGIAVETGNVSVLKALAELDISEHNYPYAIHLAIDNNDIDMVSAIIESKYFSYDVPVYAAYKGTLKIFKLIYDACEKHAYMTASIFQTRKREYIEYVINNTPNLSELNEIMKSRAIFRDGYTAYQDYLNGDI